MNGHQLQRAQSAEMIETALFELIGEKEFSRITVSEIVNRADIGRRTFYRLFKSKEDVLHCYFVRLCETYQSAYSPLKEYDLYRISKEFFCFWYSYKEILMLLHKAGLDELLYCEISRQAMNVVKSRIDSKALRSDEDMRFFADYSTGGFILLLRRWVMEGMQEAPEQYAAKVSGALLKFIVKAESRKTITYRNLCGEEINR